MGPILDKAAFKQVRRTLPLYKSSLPCVSLSSLLVVQLHDRIDLLCWVNSSEAVQDKYENVMFLTEEEDMNNCNGTTNTTKKFAECLGAIDIIIDITDHKLATKLSFEPGETYYLTSKLVILVL